MAVMYKATFFKRVIKLSHKELASLKRRFNPKKYKLDASDMRNKESCALCDTYRDHWKGVCNKPGNTCPMDVYGSQSMVGCTILIRKVLKLGGVKEFLVRTTPTNVWVDDPDIEEGMKQVERIFKALSKFKKIDKGGA